MNEIRLKPLQTRKSNVSTAINKYFIRNNSTKVIFQCQLSTDLDSFYYKNLTKNSSILQLLGTQPKDQ